MGWDWNLILMPYGKRFQGYRRAVQQEFQPSVVSGSYRQVIEKETVALLDRILKDPAHVVKHFKQSVPCSVSHHPVHITSPGWLLRQL